VPIQYDELYDVAADVAKPDTPVSPFKYLLYFVALVNWLSLAAFLLMFVYVFITDAYPGSWHPRAFVTMAAWLLIRL